MRYAKMIVKLPADMEVGCEVGVIGEGHDVQTITGIDRDEVGDVTGVHLSGGWREPLSKIYLLRGRSHREAADDPTSWIEVAIGECDQCGKKFPDSCAYHTTDIPGAMICRECHKVSEGR